MQQDSSFLPVSVAVFDRTVPSCLCLRNPVGVFDRTVPYCLCLRNPVGIFDRTVPSCLCLRNPVAVFVHVYFPVKVPFTFLSTTSTHVLVKYTISIATGFLSQTGRTCLCCGDVISLYVLHCVGER